MNEIEIKRFVSITVVLSIVIWTTSIILFKVSILSIDVIKFLSMPVTILTLYWFFYFKWGWKIPILNKIFKRPNLNGTWIGTYRSEDNSNNQYFGRIVLTVRQTFLLINFVSLTSRFVSYSYGESLLNNEKEGVKRVTYFYSQKRLNSEEENIPQGASELSILGKEKEYLMCGDFWTARYTKGFLKLRLVSKNCVESYQEAEQIWSNEEQWIVD